MKKLPPSRTSETREIGEKLSGSYSNESPSEMWPFFINSKFFWCAQSPLSFDNSVKHLSHWCWDGQCQNPASNEWPREHRLSAWCWTHRDPEAAPGPGHLGHGTWHGEAVSTSQHYGSRQQHSLCHLSPGKTLLKATSVHAQPTVRKVPLRLRVLFPVTSTYSAP
jgi:hypothetical protein